MRYWIVVDTVAETATWASGTVEANPDFPAGSTTQIVYPILTLTTDTRTETIDGEDEEVAYIIGVEQHRWSDIAIGVPTTEPEDPVDPGEYVTTIDDTVDADILKTWQVGDVDGGGVRLGLEHTKHTVPVYSETDHKWYSYTRVLTYAIDGRLFKMTAATKQTVHEPINHALL
jgi:hypothetical protein